MAACHYNSTGGHLGRRHKRFVRGAGGGQPFRSATKRRANRHPRQRNI